jgi:hypothetical protein
MKKLALLLLLTFPLFAQKVTVLRFDPPDPTSETAVVAHIHIPNFGCGATGATVTRNGSIIGISLISSTVLCLVPAPADVTVDLGVIPAGVYDVVVSPGQLLLGLAEAELDVRDAHPPFTVRPNTRGSGNDVIRIDGDNNLAGATAVHFGTAAAEIVRAFPGEIQVNPPALGPGTYDVIVDKLPDPLRATAAYHVPAAVIRNPAFYERVLFPVFWSGAGRFGSQWQSEATLHNGNEVPIEPADPSIFTNLAIGTTAVATADSSRPNGLVEVLPRQTDAAVDFGLNVRDLSRDATDLGTQIPVIRESQLFARPFSIANVPNDPRYRVTLRVYDLDGPSTFGLHVFSGTTEVLPSSIVLGADAALKNGGAAVIGDFLAQYPQLAGKGSLRIEIDPLIRSGARAAWGFVSITNNDTQQVTVISPQ